MIKEIISRFFLGFAVAQPIGDIVNLTISGFVGKGKYLAVMPQLASHFNTEFSAVLFQFLIIGLIGVVFAEGALVFKIEKWSFLKQYIAHFLITSVFYVPFMCLCWMPTNVMNLALMFINLCFTYAITYMIQHKVNKATITKINAKIKNENFD